MVLMCVECHLHEITGVDYKNDNDDDDDDIPSSNIYCSTPAVSQQWKIFLLYLHIMYGLSKKKQLIIHTQQCNKNKNKE